MVALTAPSSSATIGIDALGRIESRTSGTTTQTYAFLGSSETVSRITTKVGETTTAVLDGVIGSDGSRLASKLTTGGPAFGLLVPDLHGSVAAAVDDDFSAITDAFRYDAYGESIDTAESTLPTPWRYQGRLLVSGKDDTDLYDSGARFYSPGLGVFTQFDTYAGSAQNPITMNRYLYAGANPATLIDPSGHCSSDLGGWLGCAGDLGAGVAQQLPGAAYQWTATTVGSTVQISQCMADPACDLDVGKAVVGAGDTFIRDPEGSLRQTGSNLKEGLAIGIDLAQAYVSEWEDCTRRADAFDCGRHAADLFVNVELTGLSLIYGAKGLKGLPAAAKTWPAAVRSLPALVRNLPAVGRSLATAIRAAPTAVKTIARGVHTRLKYGAAPDNIVVLGRTGNYEVLAERIGARHLAIPRAVWDGMTRDERWIANQEFLDNAIVKGHRIVLSDNPLRSPPIPVGSFFWKELEYLKGLGWTISPDGTRMVPPKK